MDRSTLLERLMTTFIGEMAEHVRTLNGELLALEKDPQGPGRAERFKTLFRAAHSLKGASRSVGLDLIEEASHRIEDVLIAARDGQVAADPSWFGLLYATADALEEAANRLREQHDLAGSPLDLLLPKLEAAAVATGHPSPPPETPETPAVRGPVAVETVEVEPAPIAPERPREPSAVVRVAAGKLDALLTRSGELLGAKRRIDQRGEALADVREAVARLVEQSRVASHTSTGPLRRDERLVLIEAELERFALAFEGDRRHLARTAGLLDEVVRLARMLPFAEACQGLERAARDVARAGGKLVELIVRGGDVEIDRSVLEGLKDPLTHLVRNAVDHGIETPEARRAGGKPETARVVVSAALRGAQVEVVVEDDGEGIDLDALRNTLRQRGLPEPADERDLLDRLFLPGVSTSAEVTSISGRGVGLDVVKSRVEACHGTVAVTTERGRGTRFTLAVPLTLTALRALVFTAGGQTFALAVANVERVVRVDPIEIRNVAGRGMLVQAEGAPLPVAPLADVLGLPDAPSEAGRRPGLVVVAGDRRAAVLVDELLAEQEVTVKSLGDRLRRVRGVSGATILPDGRVALVLNAATLARAAPGRASARPGAATPSALKRKRVLVVDDSVTTRTLETGILESAGYDVITAVDGEDGWRVLQQSGADLLVTDVEMPRMDGFGLVETVRRSSRYASLPIILFTSRASESDRARGIEVGADAYVVKSGLEPQELLETVAQLL